MLGKILGLNKKHDQGTILGKDENRYTFVKDEIDNETTPEKNMHVEFVPVDNNKATKIHICETYIKENSDILIKITTAIVIIIVGCFGLYWYFSI